jgi:tRNA (cytidine/uridine-2'-O-)-methyltransferase
MQPDRAAPLTVALYQPEIPQNTGTILRMCACLGLAAAIIEPAGFLASDKHFRRAGMDYLAHVEIAAIRIGPPSRTGAAPLAGASSC